MDTILKVDNLSRRIYVIFFYQKNPTKCNTVCIIGMNLLKESCKIYCHKDIT